MTAPRLQSLSTARRQLDLGASTVVNDTAARPVSVALAVRADGMAQVVFGDSRGTSTDIYRSEYDPWFAQWSALSTLASDDPGSAAQQAPTVAYSTSELFAAWRDDRAGNANVQARRAALAGGAEHFGYTYDGLNRARKTSQLIRLRIAQESQGPASQVAIRGIRLLHTMCGKADCDQR